MGANVRKWQGCTLEGDGPRSPSGSTETIAAAAAAAAAAMAMVGLWPIGLRLLWQPPVEEGQGQKGTSSVCGDRWLPHHVRPHTQNPTPAPPEKPSCAPSPEGARGGH